MRDTDRNRHTWQWGVPLLWGVLAGCATIHAAPVAQDVANASFQIEGHAVTLHNGRAAWPAAPGSASLVETRLVGRPATGDIDGDGDPDAVVWLQQETGGSGTFYFLAPAIRERDGYHGGAGVLVGDRIAPRELDIRNGVVFADYADRAAGEAMAAPPHVARTAHLIWQEDALRKLAPAAPAETLLQGWLVMGHEVREFRPCGSAEASQALWVLGTSAALRALRLAYESGMGESAPYSGLFISLIGQTTEAPDSGFGTAYAGALEASRLVKVWPEGTCPEREGD